MILGKWALGMGHGAWGIDYFFLSPSSPYSTPHLDQKLIFMTKPLEKLAICT
ncbi:hypothetical protein [Nostoc sp.]|uniref:hypothetical protein n=1 Tax=Nostoc sp. TaxID=1180 RepID=UPI002FFC6F2D